ncbi:pyridoxal phosphate-dependent aminotransferase [Desemzia sp. FAM 23989]|uniref:pyridoxal phosphate-dependent aminotransferase n=1 Tax=Desemzia sp. FAM 23989 TaxID=3259523 RepID=UPI003884B153
MKERLNEDVLKVETSEIRAFNQYAVDNQASLFLTLGEPDFPTPAPIKEAALDSLNKNQTHYSSAQGSLELREAICAFEKKTNHIEYSPEEVMITIGSTEAISTALATLLNPGEEVIILQPAFPLYRQLIQMNSGVCVPIDTSTNQFQLSKEMLEEAITDNTKAIIINSPNNPTGTILNASSLEVIYEAVKKHQLFVISDDVYNQLLFTEQPEQLTKYQDIRSYIIICQSFSKPYAMTGWRIGYLLADWDFIEEALKIHQYVLSCVNTFIQDAAIAALDYNIEEMLNSYRLRRDYVYNRLKTMNVDVELPDGTFYILPSIKKYGLSSYDFCQKLVLEQGVALIPGSYFEADDYVRISFCVDMKVLEAAMDKLEIFLLQLQVK